jgi:hypothetical protein
MFQLNLIKQSLAATAMALSLSACAVDIGSGAKSIMSTISFGLLDSDKDEDASQNSIIKDNSPGASKRPLSNSAHSEIKDDILTGLIVEPSQRPEAITNLKDTAETDPLLRNIPRAGVSLPIRDVANQSSLAVWAFGKDQKLSSPRAALPSSPTAK